MEILQRYENLFWLLWTCLVALTQNDRITSQKTSMFTCMQKIKFIIYFFFTILHFKESCNLIGWQHFAPLLETQNSARYVGEISISFHFRLFPIKTNMTKFSKSQKKPILDPFWALFSQIWAKMNFPGEKVYVSLSIFQLSTIVQKNEKNLIRHSWENCWTDTLKTTLFH